MKELILIIQAIARIIAGLFGIDDNTNDTDVQVTQPWMTWYFSKPFTGDTAMRDALISLVDSAEYTVDASFYQVNDPEVIDAFCRAADRLEEGKVRFTTEHEYRTHKDYIHHYDRLVNAGVLLADDSHGGEGSGLSHNKFCIVDGKYLWTGSYNITTRGHERNNNNAQLIRSAEIADAYEHEFKKMFEEKKFGTQKKADDYPKEFGPLSVYMSPTDGVRYRIRDIVKTAEKEIYFAMFTFTDSMIRDVMIEKHEKGLKVEGVFDSLAATSQYSVYKAMLKAGIDVRREKTKGLMHHRYIVIDPGTTNEVVIAGSHNLTLSATRRNDENTIVYRGFSAMTKAFLDEFKFVQSNAEPLDTGTDDADSATNDSDNVDSDNGNIYDSGKTRSPFRGIEIPGIDSDLAVEIASLLERIVELERAISSATAVRGNENLVAALQSRQDYLLYEMSQILKGSSDPEAAFDILESVVNSYPGIEEEKELKGLFRSARSSIRKSQFNN